jgi:predicted SAM-dependent methyltransferase
MIVRMISDLLPDAMRGRAKRLRRTLRGQGLRRQLQATPRRIVIGASGKFQDGWVQTDAHELNLVDPKTWSRYLEPASVDVFLAEHVWEHLTVEEGRVGARICHTHLRPGGYIRVAVPDGLYPDPEYRQYIGIDGAAGGGMGGHKVLYTYRLLQDVFEGAGFVIKLLEYHDEAGQAHLRDWSPDDGMIRRSSKYDPRGAVSIILDAMKQHESSAAPTGR